MASIQDISITLVPPFDGEIMLIVKPLTIKYRHSDALLGLRILQNNRLLKLIDAFRDRLIAGSRSQCILFNFKTVGNESCLSDS